MRPEYGRTSGGQIRIITKSGGADFHGAAYEYFRNDALNANTWQRNLNRLHRLRPALPLQPVRLQHRRAVLHPGQIQHGQEQVLLVLGPGVGALPVYRHRHLDRAQRPDAAGQFQRAVEPEQLLLR